uniref:Uncharacterized protein n=1 Tax=Callorhinchus milii TaxID=7868 RepID=A0A4W3IT85_CALMI
ERIESDDEHVKINQFANHFVHYPQGINRKHYFGMYEGFGGLQYSKLAIKKNAHLNLIGNFFKGNRLKTDNRRKAVRKLEEGEIGIGAGCKRQVIGEGRVFNLLSIMLNKW